MYSLLPEKQLKGIKTFYVDKNLIMQQERGLVNSVLSGSLSHSAGSFSLCRQSRYRTGADNLPSAR